MYAITVNNEYGRSRDELTNILLEKGIETRTFFCPMNIQPCFKAIDGWREVECPTAERLWQTGMYLPSSCTLTSEQIEYICTIIHDSQG